MQPVHIWKLEMIVYYFFFFFKFFKEGLNLRCPFLLYFFFRLLLVESIQTSRRVNCEVRRKEQKKKKTSFSLTL